MNKENFEVGKKVEIEIFWYDEDGNKFLKKVNGIIMQVTKDFIVLDNGVYNESFKYSEMVRQNKIQPSDEPYDLKVETYETDIINSCINSIKKEGTGYVLNKEQQEKVIKMLCEQKIEFLCQEKDGTYYFKKI